MARHTAYTYYTTGDKLLKKVEFYNNEDVTPYKSLEYAYNSQNQVTSITIKYNATIIDTIAYTYNNDGTIADVSITHSTVAEATTQSDDNETVGETTVQSDNSNEEVVANE